MTPTNSNSDDALAALLDPTRDVLDLPPDVVSDAKTLGRLSALCELHDWRTQFYLSKYRMAAANRLLQLASSADDGGDARAREAQRKACVDALRLNVASLARPGRWTDRRDRDGPQRLFARLDDAGYDPTASHSGEPTCNATTLTTSTGS